MSQWTLPGHTELRELGSGGFGRVVLARDDASGGLVAIKYLFTDRLGGEAFLTAFRDEARVLAMLDSPYVTRLYGYVEEGDHAAIVMEAVDGASLRAVLDEHGPAGPEAALAVLKGSLLGLAAAHAAGVVHRDYKPANVLVQHDGQSKLADFGIAVRSGTSGDRSGTPSYMAPEQWKGGAASPATDVYAATCVFFECLAGHRPYAAQDPTGLKDLHTNAPIPMTEVPEPIRPLIARGMAKDPAHRPTGALDFVAELEESATRAYGRDWERNGRKRLAEVAAGLAALFPLALATSTAPGGGAGAGTGPGSGSGSAGTGAGSGSGGTGVSGAAPGRTTARRLLGKAGTKAAVAITGALIIGAAGTAVLSHHGKGHAKPPLATAAPKPLSISFVSLDQRFTKPTLNVAGKYVKVSGLPDPKVEDSVNRTLRLPLDQQLQRYRTHRLAIPVQGESKVTTTIQLGLRGPRLLSVRYRFDGGGTAPLDRPDMFVSRAVTVDLTTGRRLRATDILQPQALTPSGIRGLIQRIGRNSPNGSLCPGGKVSSPRLSSSGIDSDDKDRRYLDLLPGPDGIEFNVVMYMMGYAMGCDESFVSIPYSDLADLISPAIVADARHSGSIPAPSPT
ncbi:hypothetical protein GCM10023195_32770 [Actinoallomurus liliacearum]|uniref:non-specific serine/threonine protein kinase n=1 Tax=Actinoallomurus liliacearum TaxID=1080073 RepID=A0ABP8TMS2_9ACTN